MNTTITTDRLRFRGRISKMGNRFVIYVPKALNEMVKKFLGIELIVILEVVRDERRS